jgi:hypothetical protein
LQLVGVWQHSSIPLVCGIAFTALSVISLIFMLFDFFVLCFYFLSWLFLSFFFIDLFIYLLLMHIFISLFILFLVFFVYCFHRSLSGAGVVVLFIHHRVATVVSLLADLLRGHQIRLCSGDCGRVGDYYLLPVVVAGALCAIHEE